MSITTSEIDSQPAIWRRALATLDSSRHAFGEPGERVLFLGCGTSEFISESIARLRENAGLGLSDAAYASEWTPGRHYDRVVALSRSGTTSEVLDVLNRVPSGIPISAITGVADGPLAELADSSLVLDYADERSVVQTRFPSTVLTIARSVFGEDLSALPSAAEEALSLPLPLDASGFDHFVFLGSGWRLGLAQEAALKIREAAQAWSESYPILDYRHGPIAVAHPGSLVWFFGEPSAEMVADVSRTGAEVHVSSADPLVELVQAQRLAVSVAESRQLDVDEPRHLTRSVILT